MVRFDKFGQPRRSRSTDGALKGGWQVYHPDVKSDAWSPRDLLPWTKLRKGVSPDSIEHLAVSSSHDDIERGLPRYLKELPSLRSLMVPSQICKHLSHDDIPNTVEFLGITTRYDSKYGRQRKVHFSGDSVFRNVRVLSGPTYCHRCETRFIFSAESFPRLVMVGLTLDSKKLMYDTLCSLSKLLGLEIAGFATLDELTSSLKPLTTQLTSLNIAGTHRHESIEGIQAFRKLKHLKLTGFSKLTDLSPVRNIKPLESCGIYWSKRVRKLDALLKMPNLKRLDTFGNDRGEPFWNEFLARAENKGIDVSRCF